MIVGQGMLARAFDVFGCDGATTIFVSGVSNSRCTDALQFEREESLLRATLDRHSATGPFVYFGTCSVYDPSATNAPYVVHKRRMEDIVLHNGAGLVVRLPQVAGPKSSPDTLLLALCNRIRAREPITIWRHATRNIIDVADVVRIVTEWLQRPLNDDRIVNIASPVSFPIARIVDLIEHALGIKATCRFEERGAVYNIDISAIVPIIERLAINFDGDYVIRVVEKYYL